MQIPRSSYAVYALVVIALMAVGQLANASLITLEDANSTVSIDTSNSRGVYDWTVNGVDQLGGQWFYFRTDSDNSEQAISSLNQTSLKLLDVNDNPGNDTLFVKYTASKFTVALTMTLTGGTSGFNSDMGEVVKITNTTASALHLNFYQYLNFDLSNTPNDETALVTGGNTATILGSHISAQEVATPAPTTIEAGQASYLLGKLADGTASLFPNVSTVLTGDPAWVYAWDVTIPVGGSFIISKDKLIADAPEPGTLALLGMGGLALVRRRRE